MGWGVITVGAGMRFLIVLLTAFLSVPPSVAEIYDLTVNSPPMYAVGPFGSYGYADATFSLFGGPPYSIYINDDAGYGWFAQFSIANVDLGACASSNPGPCMSGFQIREGVIAPGQAVVVLPNGIGSFSNSPDFQYPAPSPSDFFIEVSLDPRFTLVPAVPELSTWAMLLIGFASLGFLAYRQQRARAFLAARTS